MPKIGMVRGMRLCAQYRKMDEPARQAVRQARLAELVQYARTHSPYYRQLYDGIGDNFLLAELPPTSKRELMAHFDAWVTDRHVQLSDVNAFLSDPDNIGRKLFGKYMVLTTSGSTGDPLIALADDTVNALMGAINALRAYARKEDLLAFMKRGGKTIGIFATGGFYLGNSSVRARLRSMPWKKRQMRVTSALKPIPEIVAELNAFQPAMLGGYPTILELLLPEAEAGRLKIQPVLIMTGGELLSDALRERLAQTFGCYVQTSYSCTECGTIACECSKRHFHINDDWILVEPVDRENKPVPDGTLADKLLVTNLFNFTQPFIRYEITDRVTLHREPCPCGNKSPYLTLEGRTDDIARLLSDGKEIRIAPLAIYAVLHEVAGIRRFQLIADGSSRVLLRLDPADGADKAAVFAEAASRLTAFFALHGATNVSIALAEEPPAPHPKSGKFQHVICR